MKEPRVILTAGDPRSIVTEAIGELLCRDNVDVAGVLLVSTVNLKRFTSLVRQRGLAATVRLAKRSFGIKIGRDNLGRNLNPISAFTLAHGIRQVGLRRWCTKRNVPLWVVNDINGHDAIRRVLGCKAEAVIYTGGGILSKQFIATAGKVVNGHAGPLPEIRGMNAAEWAALMNARAEVTVHLIDTGIDTGTVIGSFAFDRQTCCSVEELRSAAVVRCVEAIREVVVKRSFDVPIPSKTVAGSLSRQCFIMAPALVAELERRLAMNCIGK